MFESRHDLDRLLSELKQYEHNIKPNQIIIPVPKFMSLNMYGIDLVCRPDTTDIDIYLCDDSEASHLVYLGTIDHYSNVQYIIDTAIKMASICSTCLTNVGIDNIIINTRPICRKCSC